MNAVCTVVVVFASLAPGVSGHAAMIEPPTRNSQGWSIMGPGCPGGSCLFFVQGAGIGCKHATNLAVKDEEKASLKGEGPCEEHAEPTIPFRNSLGTYNLKFHPTRPMSWWDWTKYHPWRYPGSAPVVDACGLAGGWQTMGVEKNGGRPPFGIPQGMGGSKMSKLLKETVWIAGSVAEVAFALQANHGGGYQYRLCPANSPLTEDCFQANVLEFVGKNQWLQFGGGKDVSNRTEIPAVDVSKGTVPEGSTWRRNPIPPCGDSFHGGSCDPHRFLSSPLECFSSAFKPAIPGVYGFGGATCTLEDRDLKAYPKCHCTLEQFKEKNFDFSIVDQVQVPDTPGEYVLGWRWDSEQTNQVWSNCADVRIVKQGEDEATKPFQPYDGCEACCSATWGICANCTKCVNDKSGDCEYCWKPLPGFHPIPFVPQAQCLGHESETGGPKPWKAGDNLTLWSPGCTKCWLDGTCDAAAKRLAKIEV